MKIAYICSAGHSGSTLLDMMLGCHSAALSLGELILLPFEWQENRTCTCGQPIRECTLWSQVMAQATLAGPLNVGWMPTHVHRNETLNKRYSTHRKISHLTRYAELAAGFRKPLLAGKTYREGLENTVRLYDTIERVSSKQWLVNSSKHYLLAIDNYLAMPGQVKIVNLVRDGRAVFNSFRRLGFDRPAAVDAWANHYKRAERLFDRWIPKEDLHTIRYEALASDPATAMQELCRFLEIPYEASMLNLGSATHHNVNGNNMRFNKDKSIRLDERWRRELSAEDLGFFEKAAGSVNKSFGYGA